MTDDTIEKTIDKVNDVIDYIKKLITYLEEYLVHSSREDASDTEHIIIDDLEQIHVILSSILHHIQDDFKLRNLVHQEINIIIRIEKYIKDMVEHPRNIIRDSKIINALEDLLSKIELKEEKILEEE
jgi:hypothetical protein